MFDLSPNSQALLIAFGGWAGKMGMPQFHFDRISRALRVKRILLRDPKKRTFLMGVPGVGKDVEEIVQRLRRLIEESGTDRIVVIGNSMGGYAATLFGVRLNAPVIHSFAPRTSFLWYHRIHYPGFWRIWKIILELNVRYRGPRRYLDLKKLLRAHPGFTGRIHIHYSSRLRLDRKMAERLAKFPNVTLHAYPFGGHNIVRDLKRNGELQRILADSIRPEQQRGRSGMRTDRFFGQKRGH